MLDGLLINPIRQIDFLTTPTYFFEVTFHLEPVYHKHKPLITCLTQFDIDIMFQLPNF